MKKNSITIDLQNESNSSSIPDIQLIKHWVCSSLSADYSVLEQTIRIVDESESQQLNKSYRAQDKPTNVLSFPSDESTYLDYVHLGDLVICAPIVEQESLQQKKPLVAHWAHMVVHGMLHLQGFDHIDDEDAQKMEALEIEILAGLGHTNPYQNP